MKIRAVITGLVLTAALAYGLVRLYSYRSVLETNRAQWLINQGKLEEAGQQLEKVTSSSPGNVRAQRLLALVLLDRGRNAEAAALVEEMRPSAMREFYRGVLAYVGNREEDASQHFSAALQAEGELTDWMREIAQLASTETDGGSRAVPEPGAFAGRLRLERMLREAYGGRALYRFGAYEQSRAHLDAAWKAGDANLRTMVLGAVANGLTGDYARSLRYADRASSRPAFLRLVTGEADDLSSSVLALPATTLQEAVDAQGVRHKARRVAVWAGLADAFAGGRPLGSPLVEAGRLADEEPEDPAAGLLYGDALEAAGEFQKAYEQYARVWARSPSYPLLLRMMDLAGPTSELKQRESRIVQNELVVTYLSADDLGGSTTARMRGMAALLENGSLVGRLEVSDDGEFQLALIAKADRAFGLGAIAAVWLDGRRVEDIYIGREGVDVYPLRTTMSRGVHELRLEYVNDQERRPSMVEDRNLYVQGVLLTRVGGK